MNDDVFNNLGGASAHSVMHSSVDVWRRYLIVLITFEDNDACGGGEARI